MFFWFSGLSEWISKHAPWWPQEFKIYSAWPPRSAYLIWIGGFEILWNSILSLSIFTIIFILYFSIPTNGRLCGAPFLHLWGWGGCGSETGCRRGSRGRGCKTWHAYNYISFRGGNPWHELWLDRESRYLSKPKEEIEGKSGVKFDLTLFSEMDISPSIINDYPGWNNQESFLRSSSPRNGGTPLAPKAPPDFSDKPMGSRARPTHCALYNV